MNCENHGALLVVTVTNTIHFDIREGGREPGRGRENDMEKGTQRCVERWGMYSCIIITTFIKCCQVSYGFVCSPDGVTAGHLTVYIWLLIRRIYR